MHPDLYLQLHHQQVQERIAESHRRSLVAQVVRARLRRQCLEQRLSELVYRVGFWVRVQMALPFA